MSTGVTPHLTAFGPRRGRYVLLTLLVASFAIIVGIAIGLSFLQLAYVVALAAIPLAFKWPAEFALGSVALALPFEAMIVAVKSGSGTTSLMWFVSAGAMGLLLARILNGIRHAPPRAAIFWVLLIAWETTTILWAIDSNVSLKRLPMAWSLLIF